MTDETVTGIEPHFAILGSFECRVEEQPVGLRGQLQERLIAYLLLNRDWVVPVSRLVEVVWENGGPDTASHQVRKMASDLRKRVRGLDRALVTVGAGYRLSLPEQSSDLGLFTSAMRDARSVCDRGDVQAEAALLRLALGQWRGPVLNGGGGPVIESLSTALEERKQGALERLFAIRLDRGEADGLIGDLREAVAISPVREELRGQLMRALCLVGRQTEALAEYQRVRKLLHDEHGVEPGGDLAELHQRILRGDPGLSAPRRDPSVIRISAAEPLPAAALASPTTLPYDLPDFTGRGEELTAVLDGAMQARSGPRRLRIVAIDGMAGSGKSTLAIHAAHLVHESYPDGRLYLDLHGFTPGREPIDVHLALGVLLGALGLSGTEIPVEQEARIARWRAATSERRMLLVLDDVRGAAQVRALLPSSPDSLVLVTSRFRLTGIDGASLVSLDVLSHTESLSLLERVLGRDRVAAEPEAALRLASLCGHLPLALRISAARLATRRYWSIASLAARLADETRGLAELVTEDRSVLACIRSSLEALEPEQFEALRTLCLHPGEDIEIRAAAALTGLDWRTAEDTVEFLLDQHLMEPRTVDHYTIHALVRTAALDGDGADCDADDGRALDRLADHYGQAVSRAADMAFPARRRRVARVSGQQAAGSETGGLKPALAWLDAEYRNVLPTLAVAARRGRHELVFECARDLVFHLHLRERTDALMEAASLAMAAARSIGDPPLLRMGLVNLAIAHWRCGKVDEGLSCLRQALEVMEQADDRAGQAICLSRLGTFSKLAGDDERAVGYLERCIPVLEEFGDIKEAAEARVGLSSVLNALGRYGEAAAQAEAVVAVRQDLIHPTTQVMGLVNLGVAQTGLGANEQAIATLHEALDRDQRTGGSTARTLILARIVRPCLMAGDSAEAEESARRAADEMRAPGMAPVHRAVVLILLGEHHLAAGRRDLARRLLTEAHTLSEQFGLRREAAQALACLACA